MPELPPRTQQIIQAHAEFIVMVVKACSNAEQRTALEPILRSALQYGQQPLVDAVRKILAGNRGQEPLLGLDEDDVVIVEAILRGLQNPHTLPDPKAQVNPAAAAPGLAHMIHAAAQGNTDALQVAAGMAEQMTAAGGGLARLGGIMRRLIDGERDPDQLCAGMDSRTESLVLSILEELAKLEVH